MPAGSLLRSNGPFRVFFTATALSAVGTYLAAIALTVHVEQLTDSGRWVAGLLIADFLPIVVIGLLLGPLIDRLQRRRLMIGADLVRLVVFGALPFIEDPATIVALAAVNGVATGFFRPAAYAGLPNLVDDDDLEQANSLLASMENLAWTLGPVAAGGMLVVAGEDAAYAVNAVSFLASALLIGRLTKAHFQSVMPLSRGHGRDVLDGLSLVFRTPALVTVFLVWNVAAIATAGINLGEVFFAKDTLGAGDFGFGVLVTSTGVGLVIGGLLAPQAIRALSVRYAYGASIAWMGVGFLAVSRAPTLWVAAPLIAVATIGNGCALVCNQVLIQRGAPDAMRGRAVAVLMSSYFAIQGVAMVGAGWLIDREGARTVWLISAIVYLGGALLSFLLMAALRVRAELPPEPELDGISRLHTLLVEIEETRRAEVARGTPRRKVLKYANRRH
ncbi:MAG: MFS transporter [Gaiella sp.]